MLPSAAPLLTTGATRDGSRVSLSVSFVNAKTSSSRDSLLFFKLFGLEHKFGGQGEKILLCLRVPPAALQQNCLVRPHPMSQTHRT